MIKKIVKKIAPKFLLSFYHRSLSVLGAILYGWPSNKLIVIGVTGTNGKSTVVNLITYLLENAGYKVGSTSTVSFKIGDQEWLNDKKMTMIGRLGLQKMLSKMVKAKCDYAVVETSSEGIKQFRHLGINYDVAVFTNLTPEHLESHGGFENYKKCKLQLFGHLTKYGSKKIKGKKIQKVIVANKDDQYFAEFTDFKADQKLAFSMDVASDFQGEDFRVEDFVNKFKVQDTEFAASIIGEFNVYNILAALAVGSSQGLSLSDMSSALDSFKGTPGRMEFIENRKGFRILVDYAPEIESLKQLYETLDLFQYNRLIHILGSCGGGRDVARRPVLGKMAGQKADVVIVANEDPYDDDPMEIIDQVAEGAISEGKILDQNLFKIEDRREAIKYALSIAQDDDLVLLTGKGAEQFICVKDGQKISWDERTVVRELLREI
jgi:UDP-N-acetylmuramoyl-L-alanyl-D-glutamate--2,6-diaminopimelate ligase